MDNASYYSKQIRHNRMVHDESAIRYEEIHHEIFNSFEQARLETAIRRAVAGIVTASSPLRVLDFGSGTGNLTSHLLRAGVQVVACDVSPASLELLRRRVHSPAVLQTDVLNGIDLRQFKDEVFDMVATYSVLHHVPDYLHGVREFIRVLKKGGVIFIDHEAAPEMWSNESEVYGEYLEHLESTYGPSRREVVLRRAKNVFSLAAWRRLVGKKLFGLNPEGDIHVTADDHIEWDKIEEIMAVHCEILRREDYLVCRETESRRPVYSRFVGKCADMRLFVARKVRVDGELNRA